MRVGVLWGHHVLVKCSPRSISNGGLPFCWQGFTLIAAWINNIWPCKMWDEIPKFQQQHRWSFGMDKYFHPTLNDRCTYLNNSCWDYSESMVVKGDQGILLDFPDNCLTNQKMIMLTDTTSLVLDTTQLHVVLCGALRWRNNGCDSVSNHQPHDCLLNRLFRRRSKKTSKLRITGFCAGNSPVTGEFPAQMASNAENVSIWWRHHGMNDPYKSCRQTTSLVSTTRVDV